MFEASVDGRPYDNDRWGAYYRPYGLEAPAGATQAEQKAPATTAPEAAPAASNDVPWEEDAPAAAAEPVVVPQESTSSDKAQDILAMIRARQAK